MRFSAFALALGTILLAPVMCFSQDDSSLGMTLGDLHSGPVYYEVNGSRAFYMPNLELLADNKVVLKYYDAVDLSGFDWATGGVDDYSWWIQIEELRFLLPLLDSADPEHYDIAVRWVRHWMDHHPTRRPDADAPAHRRRSLEEKPNRAAWGEAMSVAYRCMVLVYLLKKAETRQPRDEELIALLYEHIYDHMEHLADPANFSTGSNHGLIESLGMFEGTRAINDGTFRDLGLKRLLSNVETSLSSSGMHVEHSPMYHFVYLNWLDDALRYLKQVAGVDPTTITALEGHCDRMKEMSYFLQDHEGNIPQIGDSNEMTVAEGLHGIFARFHPAPVSESEYVFDTEAAFAIYKGRMDRGDDRYIVYCIQQERPMMKYHYHDDVQSVYLDCGGEVILGDPGVYEYNWNRERRYLASPSGHNTICRRDRMSVGDGKYSVTLAMSASMQGGDDPRFHTRVVYSGVSVERTVTVPKEEEVLRVHDSIHSQIQSTKPNLSATRELAAIWNLGKDVGTVEWADTTLGDGELEWLMTTGNGRRYRMRVHLDGDYLPSKQRFRLVVGQEDPMLGWRSRRHLEIEPNRVVVIELEAESLMAVTTTVTRVE